MKKILLIPSMLVAAVLVFGAMLMSTDTLADDVVSNVSITVPVSCLMTPTVGTAHSANINNGTYEDEIGITTLKVVCNENSGFSIYAIGYSNNEYGNNKLLATVGGELRPTYDIVTGTAKTGNVSNWAMKLIPVSGTYTPTIENSYSDYNNVPATYTKVATFASSTDATVGASVQATYAAYVQGEQPAGTYAGKVKYTLVHPASEVPLQPQTPTAGCINYFANASDAVGTMGCQSASDNASITLLASNFSRTGYGFAGWSDAFDYKTNENAHFYGPQETITVPTGTTANGLALYAVWVKSAGNLQDTTKVAELCGTGTNALTTAPTNGTANLSSVSALTDQRDNNTYAIAKLADGNCWMIENLRLENTGTDNTNGSLAQGYNTSFAGLADPEAASLFTSTATANTLYSTDGSTEKTISGSNQGYRFPRYNNVNTPTTATDRPSNPTTNSSTNSTSDAGMYSYGNYYTWAAAIADTTAYTSNNTSVTNTSICPSGWHLPKGGDKTRIESNDDNDFWNLTVDALNGGTNPANYDSQTRPYYTGTTEAGPVADKLRSYPNNFVYSGSVYSGSVYNRGSGGYYWSSTAYSSYYAYGLYLNSSYVSPGTTYDNIKYNGRTVRCVVSGV